MILCSTIYGTAEAAQERQYATSTLKRLSVEELMDIEVTSVSRTEETLGGAAAALTVLTGEDIRRSGATSVPEALRLVPGIHVARRNANSWAVSSRGFSSVNSEKLLVLTDTRSLYTPLYSGVFWDAQDYLLEDIERIEVIRGPGAALWGSNAVNGVISITTRQASDTQGLYVEGGAGTEERVIAGARYGAPLGEAAHYRVFAKYLERDGTFHGSSPRSDDWRLAHFGFRSDWQSSAQDAVTVQGDVYQGDVGQLAPAITVIGRAGPSGPLEVGVSGGNVLGRWQRTLGADSDIQLRAYYDRTERDDPSYRDTLDTVDIDFQHRLALSPAQQLTWGLNYRYTSNSNQGKVLFALAPEDSRDYVLSAFVQDQISFTDAVRLTMGTKLEHNDYSGFEVQPSVRLAWDAAAGHTVWSAVSRAVRVPTRLERDIAVDVTDPAANPLVRLLGNKDFDSEELLAYELGYRWQALETLSIDLAAFHNRYEGLASLELGTPFVAPDGRTILPVSNLNLTDGRTRGVEALVTFAPLRFWRLTGSYSYIDIELDPRGQDLNRGSFLEGATPRHQFGLRSLLDLPAGVQLDAQFRTSSAIRRLPEVVSGEGIAGYSELDLRIAWQVSERTEVAVVGQNLLQEHHAEFGTPASRGEIERSVYGKVVWNF
jgi:iron complex outermembrane recepter protein